MDPRTAKPRTLISQATHRLQQWPLIVGSTNLVTLRATRLPQHMAGPPLRHALWPQTTTHCVDCLASPLGAHQFPLEASRKISMSNAWLATSFFSRAFSVCRAFSSLAVSGAMPPYF